MNDSLYHINDSMHASKALGANYLMINIGGFYVRANTATELQSEYNALKGRHNLKGETANLFRVTNGVAKLVRSEVGA